MKKRTLLALLSFPLLIVSCSKEAQEEEPVIDPTVEYLKANQVVSRFAVLTDGTFAYDAWTAAWYTSNLSGVTQLSLYGYTLKSDGTVWGVTTGSYATPFQVSGLSGIVKIANSMSPGGGHLLALKNDGTVWAMGNNTYGELGNNSTTNSTTPVQVQGLTNVTSISSYIGHSLAVKADGTVWGWGLTSSANGPSTVPLQVAGLSDIVNVSVNYSFAAALTDSGTVYTWGTNGSGQLGNGTTTPNSIPALVPGLTDVAQVETGNNDLQYNYVIARKTDGTVWSWGSNVQGYLGDGTMTDRYSPVQVNFLTNINYIHADEGSFAIDNDHYVWAWGDNSTGALGINPKPGLATILTSPMRVPRY